MSTVRNSAPVWDGAAQCEPSGLRLLELKWDSIVPLARYGSGFGHRRADACRVPNLAAFCQMGVGEHFFVIDSGRLDIT